MPSNLQAEAVLPDFRPYEQFPVLAKNKQAHQVINLFLKDTDTNKEYLSLLTLQQLSLLLQNLLFFNLLVMSSLKLRNLFPRSCHQIAFGLL